MFNGLGVILSTPVEMYRVNIIVPRDYVGETVSTLQELGVMHIAKTGEGIEQYKNLYDRVRNALEKLNSLLSYAKGRVIDVEISLLELESLDIDKIIGDIDNLYTRINTWLNRIKSIEKKLDYTNGLVRILSAIPRETSIETLDYCGKHVVSKTVIGRREQLDQLYKREYIAGYLEGFIGEEVVAIVVTTTRHLDELKTTISTLGLRQLELPEEIKRYRSVGEAVDSLRKKLSDLESEYRDLREQIKKTIDEAINDLGKYRVILENIASRIKAILDTLKSKYVVVVSGWVPKKKLKDVESVFSKKKIPAYIEAREPTEEEEPPTLLENPPILRFFEPIVKFMGAPSYREWDPTPIIAYSFSLFYGLMLGDMGYALAIILATYLVLDKFVDNPESRDYQYFKRVIIVSSLVGLIVGLLSGTVFGDLLEILGISFCITKAFSDPIEFLKVSLIIGLIHVNIAHAISLAKNYKLRNTGDVLSEIGIFVAEAFGIPYILYSMLNTPVPGIPEYMYSYMLYGAFLGVALIIVGKLMSLGGLGMLMWLFDLTGILGDVLSYSRLAGVGLATIYLASSFNMMAQMVYGGLAGMLPGVAGSVVGFIAALVVAVFGHIVNMALSALGGFIHSLRLCFVEFLSKFYEGTGYLFNPLKTIVKTRLVIE